MIILWRLPWKSLYHILRPYWHFLHFSQNEAFVKEKGQAYGTSSEMIVSNGPF